MASAAPVSSLLHWLCFLFEDNKKKIMYLHVMRILLWQYLLLFSSFNVQVQPTELPSLWSHGEATQDPRQRPPAQTPAPFSPLVEQPGFSQQPHPQGGSQLQPPTQQLAWSPLGGSAMFIPVPINPYLPQSVSMLQQWPMVGEQETRRETKIYLFFF